MKILITDGLFRCLSQTVNQQWVGFQQLTSDREKKEQRVVARGQIATEVRLSTEVVRLSPSPLTTDAYFSSTA